MALTSDASGFPVQETWATALGILSPGLVVRWRLWRLWEAPRLGRFGGWEKLVPQCWSFASVGWSDSSESVGPKWVTSLHSSDTLSGKYLTSHREKKKIQNGKTEKMGLHPNLADFPTEAISELRFKRSLCPDCIGRART